MPEVIFACTHCHQEISCDAAWAGQQVQCPLCQTPVIVPQAPGAAPTTQAKLARGHSGPAASDPSRSKPVYRQFAEAPEKKRGEVLKWLAFLVVLAGVGVGGYYGYGWYFGQREEAASGSGATPASPGDPATPAVAVAEPGSAPASQPAEQEAPVLPAKWTLDVEAGVIPKGRANGSISGTNFVVEAARLDFVGTAYLLSLRDGKGASPDREMRVYLRLKPGQPLTNQTWTVSKEMKGAGVPQVVKRWKPNPKYAPQQKSYASGYAMKLELGQLGEDGLAGKVFVALPDPERSVVAGEFKAAFALPTVGTPVEATPTPAANPGMTMNPEYQKRYGIKP
jgi:hypothetical protein